MALPHAALAQCPQTWEYRDHQDYNPARIAAIWKQWLIKLRELDVVARRSVCMDTRPFHKNLFENLAPAVAPYFAGHYRGGPQLCLQYYRVSVDEMEGSSPHAVFRDMHVLSLAAEIAASRIAFRLSNPNDYPLQQVLRDMAFVVAGIYVRFLTIHPYVNGNGHASRFIINVMFGSFDYWLLHPIPIHERPAEPHFSGLIRAFRKKVKN